MPIIDSPKPMYKRSFLEAVKKHKESGETDGLFDAHDLTWFKQNFESMLEKYGNESRGEHLEDGRVPSTQFWVVEGNTWLGRFSLRHELNDFLKEYGGHLGFYLIPEARGQGIGSWAMGKVLEEAKKMGLQKLLITCDLDNIPSQKLIQKFGGTHQDTMPSKLENRPLMRWWIDLSDL